MKNLNLVMWLCLAGMLHASDRKEISLRDFNQKHWDMRFVQRIHDNDDDRGYSLFGDVLVSDDDDCSEHSFHGLSISENNGPQLVKNVQGAVVDVVLAAQSSGPMVVTPASAEFCPLGRNNSLKVASSSVDVSTLRKATSKNVERPKTPGSSEHVSTLSDVFEPRPAREVIPGREESEDVSDHRFAGVKGHGSISGALVSAEDSLEEYVFPRGDGAANSQQPVPVVVRRPSTAHRAGRQVSGQSPVDESLAHYPSNLTDFFGQRVTSQRGEESATNPLVANKGRGCASVVPVSRQEHSLPTFQPIVSDNDESGEQPGVVPVQHASVVERPVSAQRQVQDVATVVAAAQVVAANNATYTRSTTPVNKGGFCARIAALFSCCGCCK